MRRWALILGFALIAFEPGSGETRCPTPNRVDPAFGANLDLVMLPVVVRDSSGRVVRDLTKDDFEIFDKGKRETISSFLIEDTGAAAEVGENSDSRDAVKTAGTAVRAPRSILYVFDDRTTSPSDFVPLQRAAARHFSELRDGDRAAIYSFSGRTTVDFTDDKAKLETAVTAMRVRISRGHGELNPCPDVSYYLANLIVNAGDARALAAVTRQVLECSPLEKNPEFVARTGAMKEILIGAQDTRIALDTLRTAIRRLAEVPGERTIVLASPGFSPLTPDEKIAVESILNLAAQNGVIISALDVRGVITTRHSDAGNGLAPMRAPRPDKLTGQLPVSSSATPIPQPVDLQAEYYRASALASGDVLEELAKGAGGAYCHGTNDLASCFARAVSVPEVRYIIGFSPSGVKTDGNFHTFSVRVKNHGRLNIEARRGYFAADPQKPSADAQIHDAVFSRDEVADFPVEVAAQVSKSGSADSELKVVANIHTQCLHFKKADGKNRDSLTMIVALFDDEGDYMQGTTKNVDLALADAEMGSVVGVQSNYTMKPGTYLVRLVVRDADGAEMSTHNVRVAVR